MAKSKSTNSTPTESYRHPEAESPMRPEVGVQAQFKTTKPPKTYRYDSSLSPALNFDGQNAAREQGEATIREIMDADTLEKAKAAAAKLKTLGKPFLDWAGKAERLSFDVPTLPLFVHERLSTKAILETIKGHKTDKQISFDDLFGDPRHSIADQVLKAYEHKDKWVNRMVLGDSLVVMNSLLPPAADKEALEGARMSPRLVRSQRARLGLSREAFAKLVGVSAGAVVNWEGGKSKPREEARAALIAVRQLGKREARWRLETLSANGNGHSAVLKRAKRPSRKRKAAAR
jgi:DNA-binding transcriptional regulator YiaG